MKVRVEADVPQADSKQRRFIDAHRCAQGVHSQAWSEIILQEVGGEFCHITVEDGNGDVAAWMPLFLKKGPEGIVVNSSPFYGSHGGILAAGHEAFDAAADGCLGLLRDVKALGATVVEPLQDPHSSRYGETLPVVAVSKRLAHVKPLGSLKTRDDLLKGVKGLTRSNLKRKCWKSNIVIEPDHSSTAIDWAFALHDAQMSAKGAQPKTRAFFDRLLKSNDTDRGAGRLYVGRIDGRMVAGVFMFLWKRWADYVTPVFDMEAREFQPLTAVIAHAMLDLASQGVERWNFGGSGESLDSVAAFKDTWGCDVLPYRYHIVDIGRVERLKAHIKDSGTSGYRGYYLFPFNFPFNQS